LVLLTFVGLGTTSNKNLSKAKFYIALFIDDCRNKINHLDDQHGGVWYGNNNSDHHFAFGIVRGQTMDFC